MKTSVLAAAAMAGLAAAPLQAQPGADQSPASTRAAVQQRVEQRFALRDSNHDGFLASEELGDNAAMAIGQLDTDHDGKISLAEATTAMMAMFDGVDADHDGTISAAEQAAAEARIGQPQPAPPPAPQPAPQPN